jgi:hypothetical protein
MKSFQEFLIEEKCVIYSKDQLKELEKFADDLLKKYRY